MILSKETWLDMGSKNQAAQDLLEEAMLLCDLDDISDKDFAQIVHKIEAAKGKIQEWEKLLFTKKNEIVVPASAPCCPVLSI